MSSKVCTIALGILMTIAGLTHFLVTRKYLAIVPRFLPQRTAIVVASGIIELAAGIGLFVPQVRKEAALLVLVLMIGFLPLHAWDLFRDKPAIGPRGLTLIRFFLQFALIYWAWKIWQTANG